MLSRVLVTSKAINLTVNVQVIILYVRKASLDVNEISKVRDL